MRTEIKIPFNIPPVLGTEEAYINKALSNRKLSGDGPFNKRASQLIKERLDSPYSNLTPSCTSALEMAYLLIDLKPDDEVILPSFTFTSTATAITLFGAKPVFVDVDESFNIDLTQVESAITNKTKAICVVHYAGTSCDMNRLKDTLQRQKNKIYLIEDAAQALDCYYNNKPLGTFGDIAAFSFHETKNVVCGEGGAIVVNNIDLIQRAELLKDKGTNRQSFLRGEVDKYTWQDKGSSYLLGEIPAAYLVAQLEEVQKITAKRLRIWSQYYSDLLPLEESKKLFLPKIPKFSKHNGHIFYLILKNENTRNLLAQFLKEKGISAVSHYVPLHSAPAGIKYGRVSGSMSNTDAYANCLLRLPMYYDLTPTQAEHVATEVKNFFA